MKINTSHKKSIIKINAISNNKSKKKKNKKKKGLTARLYKSKKLSYNGRMSTPTLLQMSSTTKLTYSHKRLSPHLRPLRSLHSTLTASATHPNLKEKSTTPGLYNFCRLFTVFF